jgi:hypothetical protein
MTVVGLPFWYVATRLAISSARTSKLSLVNSRNRAALLMSLSRLGTTSESRSRLRRTNASSERPATRGFVLEARVLTRAQGPADCAR